MWAWPTFGCSPITTTRLSLSLNLTGACSRGKIGLCESSRSQTRYFASRGLIHHEQNLVVVLGAKNKAFSLSSLFRYSCPLQSQPRQSQPSIFHIGHAL